MAGFDAVLEPGQSGGAFVGLPDGLLEELGQGLRFRARGTFGGVEYRSSVMPVGGGRGCLGVHKATREAAGVDFGETVVVQIEVDAEPREVVVPLELDEALSATPDSKAAFAELAPSRRRELVRAVNEAKRPETPARRIATILESLRTG